MKFSLALIFFVASCSAPGEIKNDGGNSGNDSGVNAGRFTYGFNDKVFRIEARVGASAENISNALVKFGTGTRDRWLIPSHNGKHLVLSTDRLNCSLGECLGIAPSDLSSLTLVKPAGNEISIEGTPVVNDTGDLVVYSASGGPHSIDIFISRKMGSTWSAAMALTGASTYPFNNMPALTFDEQRVLFDCGAQNYPESGNNDACEVNLDGSGFRKVIGHASRPSSRQTWVQFPHDSIDGILHEASWPVGADSPETIWRLSGAGVSTSLAPKFTNAVSPCALKDGRLGLLWLNGPQNPMGNHELTLVNRDGTLSGILTPGIDVTDIGIGCSE